MLCILFYYLEVGPSGFLYFIIGTSSVNIFCMWLILRSVWSQTTKTCLQDQGLDLVLVILVRNYLASEQLSHISEGL